MSRVVLEYWDKWVDDEAAAMRAVVNDYNASQDRIFVRYSGHPQIEAKLAEAVAAGRPPSIVGSWSYSLAAQAKQDLLTPIEEFLPGLGIGPSTYAETFWRMCVHRGRVWALPTTPSTLALHWNRQLFREAGLDPDTPPRSIVELDAMAERLTVVDVWRSGGEELRRVRYSDLSPLERAGKTFDIVQLGFSPAMPAWWDHLLNVWFGGQLSADGRTIAVDGPESIAAMEWYASYPRKFGVENLARFASRFGEFTTARDPFLCGSIAMVLQGVWMHGFIMQFAPALDWAAAPFPSVDPQRLSDVTVVDCDVVAVPRGASHMKETMEFLGHLSTREAMESLVLRQRKTSPLRTVSADFYVRHPNPYAEIFARLANSPNAISAPRIPNRKRWAERTKSAAEEIRQLKTSPAEALKRAQADLDVLQSQADNA